MSCRQSCGRAIVGPELGAGPAFLRRSRMTFPLHLRGDPAAMAVEASHGRSFYQVKVSHETMYIDKRYQKLSYIGGGAYGFVCAATDTVSARARTSAPDSDGSRRLPGRRRGRHVGGAAATALAVAAGVGAACCSGPRGVPGGGGPSLAAKWHPPPRRWLPRSAHRRRRRQGAAVPRRARRPAHDRRARPAQGPEVPGRACPLRDAPCRNAAPVALVPATSLSPLARGWKPRPAPHPADRTLLSRPSPGAALQRESRPRPRAVTARRDSVPLLAEHCPQVSKRRVAIKKIRDVFRDLVDGKRILREIKLLRHLGGHQVRLRARARPSVAMPAAGSAPASRPPPPPFRPPPRPRPRSASAVPVATCRVLLAARCHAASLLLPLAP